MTSWWHPANQRPCTRWPVISALKKPDAFSKLPWRLPAYRELPVWLSPNELVQAPRPWNSYPCAQTKLGTWPPLSTGRCWPFMDERLSRSRDTISAHLEQTEPELDAFESWFRAAVRNLLTAEKARRPEARAEAFLQSLPPSPKPLPRRVPGATELPPTRLEPPTSTDPDKEPNASPWTEDLAARVGHGHFPHRL